MCPYAVPVLCVRYECVLVSHTRTALLTVPRPPTRTCGPSTRPLPLPTDPPASGPETFCPECSPLLFLWAPVGTTAKLLDLMAIWAPLKTARVASWLQKTSTTVSTVVEKKTSKPPGSVLVQIQDRQQKLLKTNKCSCFLSHCLYFVEHANTWRLWVQFPEWAQAKYC